MSLYPYPVSPKNSWFKVRLYNRAAVYVTPVLLAQDLQGASRFQVLCLLLSPEKSTSIPAF